MSAKLSNRSFKKEEKRHDKRAVVIDVSQTWKREKINLDLNSLKSYGSVSSFVHTNHMVSKEGEMRRIKEADRQCIGSGVTINAKFIKLVIKFIRRFFMIMINFMGVVYYFAFIFLASSDRQYLT